MIESEHFFAALHVLSEVLPYQKQLSPETRGALWELFPPEAKRDLTAADLQWAVSQRLIDPNPPREMAISFVFLHYLYPKRDGWPALDAGPRRRDPQTAVRDEQKVFRADDPLMLQSLSVGEYAAFCAQRHKPDATTSTSIAAPPAPPTKGSLLDRTINAIAAQQDAPIHPDDEDIIARARKSREDLNDAINSLRTEIRRPIPPIWSEPNWQGSGRHG
jgi:hypothetical protein